MVPRPRTPPRKVRRTPWDALIQSLQYESDTIKAIAVSVGGLIGVFATLGIFFLVIQISDKISKKGGASGE